MERLRGEQEPEHWPAPTISVNIPTRNEQRGIGAVLRRLPAVVELVVVDSSSDSTADLIACQRPHRTTIIQAAAGIAAARQYGAAVARGEWLLFSDADVTYAPDYFDRVAPYLAGDAFFGPKYATARYQQYGRFFSGGQHLLHSLGIAAASGSNMAVRKAVFRAVGGFDTSLPCNEDTDLMLRIKRRGYAVAFANDLAVTSINDRRLEQGLVRKTAHSAARSLLLLLCGRLPLLRRVLYHDWGYWRNRE
ncbi:MAG: glycosyltransferase [Chloroflexales bacterium]|nr:glycosyltransferase [Chloroflexales bacterium]